MIPTAISDFLDELSRHVSGDLRSDQYSRLLYSTDASIYQVMPHAVLLPQHSADVQAAVELAHKYRVPVLARTAGSSLAGQAVNEAVIIDFTKHLNQVIELNVEERWVRVQPGIVLDELNAYLQPYGLQFGPDPASSSRAAMGGIVSNNSTGAHSILYGMTADHVLSMSVLLSDGSSAEFGPVTVRELMQYQTLTGLEADIYRQMALLTFNEKNRDIIRAGTPRHWRRCGGYNLDRFVEGLGVFFQVPHDKQFNLAKLVCGAEGTLAVMQEIKLNLVPLPTSKALAIVQFNSLQDALNAVPTMLEVAPTAIELVDNLGLKLCKQVPEYARLLATFLDGEPNCILITEFYGENSAELNAKIEKLRTHMQRQDVPFIGMTKALDKRLQANVWKVRKVGLGLLMSIKGDYKPIPFIEDAAVPTEHLAEYINRIERFCNDLGTEVAYYAHASAGCLHVRPLINAKIATDVAKLPQITQFCVELLGEYGGAFSSEHGDGRARSWLNETFFGRELYGLFKEVKSIFDPHNLLNPNNIVNAGPMTANLRYGAAYQTIELTNYLDFSADLGFNRAVEMCNGAAVCRKISADTMCPSFQVTREEEHSTRGRANLLRAVLSGQLPETDLTGDRLYAAMDLCVSCKACKAECPSSVDMARIKTEYLAHYYAANGIPRRAKLFANIAALSRLSSGWRAPLANWSLKRRPVKWGMAQVAGISSERELPEFARETFTAWFNKRGKGEGKRGRIVLFNDTFNTYNDPHIAIAATDVLEAIAYEVLLPGHNCCGRPALSKGLLHEAREFARTTLNKLSPLVDEGLMVVGLEPSCLSAIRDDYFALLPEDPRVAEVAAATISFEEFIADLAAAGVLDGVFKRDVQQVLLHGHCHQKALIGTEPSRVALTAAGCTVNEVDSGCCGMAGSFGYEAEHVAVSLAMAERRLLPAVRSADSETIIVAAGTSCREQISQGTGRTALHSAEILRNALVD